MKHLNLASTLPKVLEEVSFLGLCTVRTILGEPLGCFSDVPQ